MPIRSDLLEILVCPATKQPLEILREDQLAKLNAAITAQRIVNAGGQKVETPVAEGLITTDGKTIYRIDGDIPIMLVDEGIPAAQIESP
ncbi:MAG TPA: Trm112 family protein [Candidatus Krumholzibacteria bacterium]|nr:Trm112 family protein [Candidatus Krumholzibacteria bacterium]